MIDFDVAVRDPANPTRFLPIYQSGDQLHPSDAGYAMGDAIDLAIFREPYGGCRDRENRAHHEGD